MHQKPIRIFLKGQAKHRYEQLDQTLLASFNRLADILKINPQYGDPLSKRLIPIELKKRGITNLYRLELPHFWRMLYTIEGSEKEIFVFVVCIMSHKEYDRFFGY